jgi:hypothetical protein
VVAVIDQLEARATAVTAAQPRKKTAPPASLPTEVAPGTALPPQIAASLARLCRGRDELRVVVRTTAEPTAAMPDATRAAANGASDAGWRAFEGWLGGWAQLDDGEAPGAAEAHALHARVFPTDVPRGEAGLRFIGWRPRKQWEAMDARMEVLATEPARRLVESLGGARFLAHLRTTHAEFGRAYGFTHATANAGTPAVDTRPQWLAAQDALRDYVRKVATYADPDVPGSAALAGYLLGPFVEMQAEFAARPIKKKAPAQSAGTGNGGTPAT